MGIVCLVGKDLLIIIHLLLVIYYPSKYTSFIKGPGTGILPTAQKRGILNSADAEIAFKSMVTLNKHVAAFAEMDEVKTLKDVTGFGLLGHLSEMCEGSGWSAVLEFDYLLNQGINAVSFGYLKTQEQACLIKVI